MRTRCALARGAQRLLRSAGPCAVSQPPRPLGKTHLGAGWGRQSVGAGLGSREGPGQLPDTWFHGTVSKPRLFLAMLSGHAGALAGTHPAHMQTHTLGGHVAAPGRACSLTKHRARLPSPASASAGVGRGSAPCVVPRTWGWEGHSGLLGGEHSPGGLSCQHTRDGKAHLVTRTPLPPEWPPHVCALRVLLPKAPSHPLLPRAPHTAAPPRPSRLAGEEADEK